mmetsp:Transcript_19042/g.30228  ORF Transcript_19042/g.30228 Transcript_19042/m.30228 type:complete len:221 (-) Transcript_19042:99-761(-)
MTPPVLCNLDQSPANYLQADHDKATTITVNRDRRILELPSTPIGNTSHPELRLVRRNANHVKYAVNPESVTSARAAYTPNFEVITQFSQHPLLSNAPAVLRGFTRHADAAVHVHVPPEILSICQRYLFAEQDAFLQVAYAMFCVLRKANRASISRKLLPLAIKAYLKLTDAAKLESYRNQLVAFNYLKPIGSGARNASSYQFSIEARLLFSEYSKQSIPR